MKHLLNYIIVIFLLYGCSYIQKYQILGELEEIDFVAENQSLELQSFSTFQFRYEIVYENNDVKINGFSCQKKKGNLSSSIRFFDCKINSDIKFHLIVNSKGKKCVFFNKNLNLEDCLKCYRDGFHTTLKDFSLFDNREDFNKKFEIYTSSRELLMPEYSIENLFTNNYIVYIIQKYNNKNYVAISDLRNNIVYNFYFEEVMLDRIINFIQVSKFTNN
jgi:hypothetical protein